MKNRHRRYAAILLACTMLIFPSGYDRSVAKTAGSIPEKETLPAEFKITEKDITVPGLTETTSILFLSDAHVVKLDGTETAQVKENAVPREISFRNTDGTAADKTLCRYFGYADSSSTDAVLLGGDIIDFPSEANLEYLSDSLNSLEIPYVYALGNHDWTYPWDYMSEHGRAEYRPLFERFTSGNPAVSIMEINGIIILSIDNSSGQVEKDAAPATERAFSAGKPVIVMLHVPFSTDTVLKKAKAMWKNPVSAGMEDSGGFVMSGETAALYEKITAEDSPVVCVLAGHAHFADESLLEGRIPQITAGPAYLGKSVRLTLHG